MKEKVICGMQQVGIGIPDVIEAWEWYHETFGFTAKVLDDEGVAERMLPYTGGKPQPRRAILAYNLQGGGGLEIWQPKKRTLNWIKEEAKLGDYGIFACKIKCQDIYKAYDEMITKGISCLCNPCQSPNGTKHFFIKDPYNNIFQIEEDNYIFLDEKKATGGVNGVIIGVSNIDKSIEYYSKILLYDTIVYDKTNTFDDLICLKGGDKKVRRVMLNRSKTLEGPMCEIMGTSHIELVELTDKSIQPKKIYEGRLWGDPGFIHLCFDIRNMETIEQEVNAAGYPFVCNSGADFDMGDANAWFTYIEDPDGTLIEFVETHRIPIIKKLGLYLNLVNKDDKKPLPRSITNKIKLLETSTVK